MADPWHDVANAAIDDFQYIVDGVNVSIKDTNTAPTMVMYGDWIAPNNAGVPVDAIKKLNTGEDVYMRVDSPYIKMVTTSGVAKYYVGPNVNLFNPNAWNSYSDATGHYRLRPV